MDDDTLWMWGDNSNGQIGDFQDEAEAEADKYQNDQTQIQVEDGSQTDSSDVEGQQGITSIYAPTQVLEDVSAMSLGLFHTAALKKDGTLWAWGLGTAGQLGGGVESSKEPLKVAERVVAVSGGGMHTLFQRVDGTLWGVGYNASGQLGYVPGDDAGDADVLVTDPLKVLDGVKLTEWSQTFKDTNLKFSLEKFVQSVPSYVWIIAAGAVLMLILIIWVIISQHRIRKLRKAAVTAVAQVQQMEKEREKLLESKGTQRRRR